MKHSQTKDLLWQKSITGLCELSTSTEILSCNESLCELLDYSNTELIGKSFITLVHPDYTTSFQNLCNSLLSKNLEYYVSTLKLVSKQGKTIYATIRMDTVMTEGQVEIMLTQVEPNYLVKKAIPASTVQAKVGQFVMDNWKAIVLSLLSLGAVYGEIKYELAALEELIKSTK